MNTDSLDKSSNGKDKHSSLSASVRALCLACRRNDVKEVKRILIKDPEAGSGCDYDGRFGLHVAAAEGHVDVVGELLKYPSVNVNQVDRAGRTPLQDAISLKRYGVMELLRDHGGTVIDAVHGFRLCSASYKGDLDFIKQCAEMNYDISVSDYDSRTCLHIAAVENKVEIVKYLIEIVGLRPDPIDCFGHTPVEETRNDTIKNILLHAQSKL